jgi:uncharacterized protein involved in type VI secretion and phage assembly
MMVTEGLTQLLLDFRGSNASGANPPALMRDLISAEVHDSLFLPDMFVIRVRDADTSWLDDSLCALGNRVRIAVPGDGAPQQLIDGEITALEMDYAPAPARHDSSSVGGPALTIRGYDLSHRLNRDRKTRTFVQRSPSEVAEILGRDAGLSVDADNSRPVDYLLQNNQTDWDFLWQLARRIGFTVCVRGSTLVFTGVNPPERTVELEWGSTMHEFRAQLSTAKQVNEVVVKGWDVEGKREVTGRAIRPNRTVDIGEMQTGGELAHSAFTLNARAVSVDSGVSTQAEADEMAQALLDDIEGSAIQAEGTAGGEPRLNAGVNVSLKGLGDRFRGSYLVTECVHRYDVQGYSTRFVVGGRSSSGILEILRGSHRTVASPAIGIVTNNKDPRDMGRVKVRFPWLSENDESDWARLASPMTGDGRGFMFLPEVNDEVLVVFEHGDIHKPCVVGSLWNGRDALPEQTSRAVSSTGEVNLRVIKTRMGHTVLLDDDPSAGGIKIADSGGNVVEIKTRDGKIVVRSSGDIELAAGGKLSIQGQRGVDIQSQAEVKVQGQMIRLN